MSTRKEIDKIWEPLHARLTTLYYVEKKISKETFDKLHTAIWLLHEKQSILAKILPDFADEETSKLRFVQIAELIEKLGGETKLRDLIKQVLG